MSAVPPAELNAAAVIDLIASGMYPRDVVATIARGFLPLAEEDLIAVIVWLTGHADSEIARLAEATLYEMQTRSVHAFAASETVPVESLVRLTQVSHDPLVLEALIRNRAVPDEAIAELAKAADARVQEVIVINQARILRAPFILDALLENPGLSPDARRRVAETREEFFEKRARAAAGSEVSAAEPAEGEDEELADLPLDAIADLLERAKGEEGATAPTPALPASELKDPKKESIWSRIRLMSVAEKVQLAFKGDRTTRLILVRERNKLICAAVMRNPRMSEQEVESIAGMRNVEDEVLRLISMRRDWMSKYAILITLARNPKTPLGVVLPLINRLTLRDLKGLKDDKGVQQVVREMAKKAYIARSQKSGG
jgi:hypothetical protein